MDAKEIDALLEVSLLPCVIRITTKKKKKRKHMWSPNVQYNENKRKSLFVFFFFKNTNRDVVLLFNPTRGCVWQCSTYAICSPITIYTVVAHHSVELIVHLVGHLHGVWTKPFHNRILLLQELLYCLSSCFLGFHLRPMQDMRLPKMCL